MFVIIPYLCEAQHVSDDTPPIIRSLDLHWQPLIFPTWKVDGLAVVGRCQAQYKNTIAFTNLSLVKATEQIFVCFNEDLA
jgi:hypothetical protein